MSEIIWITKAGEITQIAEEEYYEFQLDAYDTSGSALSFQIISGRLGNGLQLHKGGLIQGIAVIEDVTNADSYSKSFTVRAKNASGKISDRTFKIVVNPTALPQIVPKNVSLGTIYDGYHLVLQLEATDPSPNAKLTWRFVSGELPPGVTMTSTGLISGYVLPYVTPGGEGVLGWSMAGWDVIIWDTSTADAQSRTYQFLVQVSDGIRYDESTYTINVLAKKLFTVDNDEIIVNNTLITVDTDDKHSPIILTEPSTLPEQRQASNFAFKIDGFDIEGAAIEYALSQVNAVLYDQGIPTGSTPGWVPDPSDQPIPPLVTVGFDNYGFDQENQTLPAGITLDPLTGWLTGYIEPQAEVEKEYLFQVYCYKVATPSYTSKPVTFTLTVLGDLNNVIDWTTPTDLGTIDNGSISELSIVANARLPGKELRYTLTPGSIDYPGINPAASVVHYAPVAYSRLPQGLQLLDNGLIIGRTTFQHFSLDGRTTTFDKASTNFDNKFTFSVTASDKTQFELDANTTTIDSGLTTFDDLYQGEVLIPDLTPGSNSEYRKTATVSDSRVFTIRINNINVAPYENIHLRALPDADRRRKFRDVIENQDIFPNELIYRFDDPYYGKAKNIKFLFAAGLKPSTAETYFLAMQNNHYNKRVELGNVKTAVALDENFNVKYEIVYVEVVDPSMDNGRSAPNSVTTPFSVIHPNSLDNMLVEVSQVTYNNKGVLPAWMINPQSDGRVLGFTRAVILAYTVPGASKLIAYRLKQENVNFGDLEFVADRYQLDDYLVTNYNLATQSFIKSKETTFDMMPPATALYSYAGSVDYAVTTPFDEINGRTLEYINRRGGISGTTVITGGQLLVFAIQELYNSVLSSNTTTYKDVFSSNNYDSVGYDLSTVPMEYTSPNDGWNDTDAGLYGTFAYGDGPYMETTVIPGYNSVDVNQRGGIWQITVNSDLVVILEFVQEVTINQYVQVRSGDNYNNTKIYYDPILQPGHTVPAYSILTDTNFDIKDSTSFDGGGTRFYSNRDTYAGPETNNKFLKFPKYGMYQ